MIKGRGHAEISALHKQRGPAGKRENACRDKIFIQSNTTRKCAIKAYKPLEPAKNTALTIKQNCRTLFKCWSRNLTI